MSSKGSDIRLEGWHARARPHPDPDSFVPLRSNLAFAVIHSAAAQPHGFTLAAFSPSIAIDALGRILILSPQDFAKFASLARQAINLPQTGPFMNAWRIDQQRTSQPIERLFVPGQDGQLTETSVQGYEKGKAELKTPVGDIDRLPPILDELFGLIAEARQDYERGKEDSVVIAKVKGLLDAE